MRVRVKVEQRHIDGASEGPTHCPLARAISEAFDVRAVVATTSWSTSTASADKWYPLSGGARAFVQRFDYGDGVGPSIFYLNIPAGVLLHAHHP